LLFESDSAENDEDDFLIEPLLEVKLETEEVTSNEDDQDGQDDFQRSYRYSVQFLTITISSYNINH